MLPSLTLIPALTILVSILDRTFLQFCYDLKAYCWSF